MDVVLLVARLVLTLTFGAAAMAKLRDFRGSRNAVADFGVPSALVPAVAMVLPIAELAVAALLIPMTTAWWGAIGAAVLLIAFIAAIGINMARGRRPDCHCFGQVHSRPIGWPTLARNGALLALAGMTLGSGRSQPGIAALAAITSVSGSRITLLGVLALVMVIVCVETWLVYHVLRQHGRLLLRVDELEKRSSLPAVGPARTQPSAMGLPIGTPAPKFSLPTLTGGVLSLDDLRAAGKAVALIFSDPNCGPCAALMPEVAKWQREFAADINIAVLSRGSLTEHRKSGNKESLLAEVLLQADREVAQAYQANGTPAAVLIRSDGHIASQVVMGSEAIGRLIAGVTGRGPLLESAKANGGYADRVPNVPALRIGDAATSPVLADLQGKKVRLEDFKGHSTLVLFWNPACGFCQRMLADLKKWRQHGKDEHRLVVVSSGSVEANRAMGLKCPVLLDGDFATARQFGARGTPSAILVDSEGKVASEIAVGAAAIFQLVGWRTAEPAPIMQAPRPAIAQ
jgi:peroxiredoxin